MSVLMMILTLIAAPLKATARPAGKDKAQAL